MGQAPAAADTLLKGEGLPDYQAITPEAVSQGMPWLLEQLEAELARIEASLNSPSEALRWDELMPPMQQLGERLRWSWGVVNHLLMVCNTPELRQAHEQQQAAVVRFSSRLGQSKAIYRALKQLSAAEDQLTPCRRRILQQELLGMELRGVGLGGDQQERFNALTEELTALSTRFSNNVLDATASWELLLSSPEEMDGCPDSLRELLADSARRKGHEQATAADGPWLMGLDYPRYGPFLQHSSRRDLREKVYRGFISRAASGEHNNSDLVGQILALRQQKAVLLGYSNWAEVSLASKMAPSVQAVETLLEDLRAPSHSAAQQEVKDLEALAGSALQPWDVSYWSEQLRQQRFDLDSEALRPWFPLPQVLDGLFNLCGRLFDIRINAADGQAPIWHEDVRFFRISDASSGGVVCCGFELVADDSRHRHHLGGVMPNVGVVVGIAWNGELTNRDNRDVGLGCFERGREVVAVDQDELGLGKFSPLARLELHAVGVLSCFHQAGDLSCVASEGFGEVAQHAIGSNHQWCCCRGSQKGACACS